MLIHRLYFMAYCHVVATRRGFLRFFGFSLNRSKKQKNGRIFSKFGLRVRSNKLESIGYICFTGATWLPLVGDFCVFRYFGWFFGQKNSLFCPFLPKFWELIKTPQMHHVSKFGLNWTIFSHFLGIFVHFWGIL